MDKVKGLAKGGWHPANDRKISKDTWKSDLKGIATGKKQDPYAYARDHQSTPLSSLKDPASFAPPPKHKDYHPDAATGAVTTTAAPAVQPPSTTSRVVQGPQGGWGSSVPAPVRPQKQELADIKPKPPPVPFRVDTSGLRTDHLPKPPARRVDTFEASSSNHRPGPPKPLTSAATQPPPVLPPRQNEFPDEFTPAPPPPYPGLPAQMKQTNPETGLLNTASINRLSQAGISVPGLGVGSSQRNQALTNGQHGPELNELQQRFARMNAGASNDAALPVTPLSTVLSGPKKGPAPPTPTKKLALSGASLQRPASSERPPPPLPMASKPRPP